MPCHHVLETREIAPGIFIEEVVHTWDCLDEQSWYDREMDRIAEEEPERFEAERLRDARNEVDSIISAIGTAFSVVGGLIIAADSIAGATAIGLWAGVTVLAVGVTTFMLGWAL